MARRQGVEERRGRPAQYDRRFEELARLPVVRHACVGVSEGQQELDVVLVFLGDMASISRLATEQYMVDAQGLNKIQGQPFKIQEIKEGIEKLL